MKGLIRLAYYKIIDLSSAKPWDKLVFEETYQEFFMQAQLFNPGNKYQTFQELLANAPNADRLHYLTSRVAMGYLKQLNQVVPGIVNAFGKTCLPFTEFKFEILESYVERKEAHRIAITFFSDPLSWIDIIDGQLLIAYGDQHSALQAGQVVNTDLIALQPYLTIWTYQPLLPATID
ncbi:hypothetical protein [Spirosoma pollinicola]|uniref:Uncharacterized protein n=1 Tax=Spirosoma pollinicola TaxID=2057025 RepID=A0A2K8Z7T0_9BACT|nr:hypothetical protein [Spirosoma pollinicola]AUD05933.1 hypothetical protein CWM47_31260 [Spirosoma pollinicola]